MEKTLTIDGKKIKFKATAGFLYRYRTIFGVEYSAEIAKMGTLAKKIKEAKENNADILALGSEIDSRVYQRILWTYAKTADPSIPDIETWLDSFEKFNAQELVSQLSDLIAVTNKSLIKNSKAVAIQNQ